MVELTEFSPDFFPTSANSQHAWLILFCSSTRDCSSGRGKLKRLGKELKSSQGIGLGKSTIGSFRRPRAGEDRKFFCASHGYPPRQHVLPKSICHGGRSTYDVFIQQKNDPGSSDVPFTRSGSDLGNAAMAHLVAK
jgi:hypothetical protein